jgi:transcriptional regulator with PAS, ATPase and Fis domain
LRRRYATRPSARIAQALQAERRALTKTRGNRTRAAEVLEISHRALLYKIKDYHIEL